MVRTTSTLFVRFLLIHCRHQQPVVVVLTWSTRSISNRYKTELCPFNLNWFKETKWILCTTWSDLVVEPFDAVSPFQASPQNCRTSGASNLSRNQTDVRWADSREKKSCKKVSQMWDQKDSWREKKSPRCEMGGSEKINSGHTNIWHLVIVDVRFVKFPDLKRHSLIITTSLKPTRSLQFCCRNSGSVVTIFTGLSLEGQLNKLSFKVSQVWWGTESKCFILGIWPNRVKGGNW